MAEQYNPSTYSERAHYQANKHGDALLDGSSVQRSFSFFGEFDKTDGKIRAGT